MSKGIVIIIAFMIFSSSVCGCSTLSIWNDKKQELLSDNNEIKDRYKALEDILIPLTEDGRVDFDAMVIDDHQFIAYLLRSELRNGEIDIARELTEWLINHSDDDGDGEIGWGLGQAWDAFSDGSINPKWHTYAIETINVMDAYLDAIDSNILTDTDVNLMKNQIHDVVMLCNGKYWSERGTSGENYFYWYSVSPNDAIGCLNIDAKMVGTQARILFELEDLFTEEERQFVYDRLDKTYNKVLEMSYLQDNAIVWNYLEREGSQPNDVIHHGFILEGISDYNKYRKGNEKLDDAYNAYINQRIMNGHLYSYPDHEYSRCFDSGAIRWVDEGDMQKQLLLSAYNTYVIDDADKRQLAFLLDAMSIYLTNERGTK